MRIALLSTNDLLGGAATVTFRLTRALRAMGHDARMVVARKDSDEPWVERVNPVRFMAAKVAERLEIMAANGLTRRDLWRASTGGFGCGAAKHPFVRQADAVVINWVCQGLLSLADIGRLAAGSRPVAWVMHDLWCATGICHIPGGCHRYEGECGNCPLLHGGAAPADLSHRVWLKKQAIFASASALRLVAVSEAQRRVCRQSELLKDREISVIPHAFEILPPEPWPDEVPAIPEGEKLLVMCAANLSDPVKDLPAAIAALNRVAAERPDIARKVTALFIGNVDSPATAFGSLKLKHLHIPSLSQAQLRGIYPRTDVVISSSSYETVGATLIEAMAYGATPAAFPSGGRADFITDSLTGYLAASTSTEALASAICRAFDEPLNRDAQRSYIASRFSPTAVADRLLTLLTT